MIEAAVFDLDGVLINTEGIHWQGWARVLRPYGVNLTKEEYVNYAGKRGDRVEEEIIREYSLDVPKGVLLEKKDRILVEFFRLSPPETMPHAREAIEFFTGKKMKVALASAGPRLEVLLKLEGTGLSRFFETAVTGDDVERGKPFPDIYEKAVEMMGVDAKNCISFEDTGHGVEAAKDAGLTCLAIPSEFTEKQDFSRADARFENLKEAISWVEKIV
jgi:HAD superfamily hydrolase (TIGR01509 family)